MRQYVAQIFRIIFWQGAHATRLQTKAVSNHTRKTANQLAEEVKLYGSTTFNSNLYTLIFDLILYKLHSHNIWLINSQHKSAHTHTSYQTEATLWQKPTVQSSMKNYMVCIWDSQYFQTLTEWRTFSAHICWQMPQRKTITVDAVHHLYKLMHAMWNQQVSHLIKQKSKICRTVSLTEVSAIHVIYIKL